MVELDWPSIWEMPGIVVFMLNFVLSDKLFFERGLGSLTELAVTRLRKLLLRRKFLFVARCVFYRLLDVVCLFAV